MLILPCTKTHMAFKRPERIDFYNHLQFPSPEIQKRLMMAEQISAFLLSALEFPFQRDFCGMVRYA